MEHLRDQEQCFLRRSRRLFGDELEELAMRVAAPALVGGTVPITDQLESIKESVERLDRTRRVALIPVRAEDR